MAILEVSGLSKKFHPCATYQTTYRFFVSRFLKREKRHDFYALRDVSFTAERGEKIGVIGDNGCGKTTLLKIIAGLYRATEGSVRTEGSVASFLQLGVGIEPELTAIQNIHVLGVIMGMRRHYIREKMDEIIAFSEIDPSLINRPLKYFSSGMIRRISFALIPFITADILVMDEVLVNIDVKFREKCVQFLETYVRQKRGTVLMVSHDMELIGKFCDRALFLHQGRQVASGTAGAVVDQYLKSSGQPKLI